jgi:hypothetical protein
VLILPITGVSEETRSPYLPVQFFTAELAGRLRQWAVRCALLMENDFTQKRCLSPDLTFPVLDID